MSPVPSLLPTARPLSLAGSFAQVPVLILGLARQGQALVRFFVDQNARITVSDRTAVPLGPLQDLPRSATLRYVFGPQGQTLLQDQQLVCLSAGVPRQLPLVQAAVARGLPVINDSLLTFARAPCPITLITGSHGKTTTTKLAGAIMARAFPPPRRVHVGGNTGTPLLAQVSGIRARDHLLWEGSSFQLELFDPACTQLDMADVQLDAAALLNVTPNHLDRHPDMADYLQAKLRALQSLRPRGHLVLNLDDPVCRRLYAKAEAPLSLPAAAACETLLHQARQTLAERAIRLIPYSLDSWLPQGACIRQGWIWIAGTRTAPVTDIRLRGRHNLGNALAACALARIHQCPARIVRQVLQEFQGVAHRLEPVMQRRDVLWINDSIATTPERAVAGIESCSRPGTDLILLAGGKDKHLPWSDFAARVVACVQTLISFGQAGPLIAEQVARRRAALGSPGPSIQIVDTLAQAVHAAARQARPGALVLMSPGAASFDGYADFEARGRHFRQLVQALEETARS